MRKRPEFLLTRLLRGVTCGNMYPLRPTWLFLLTRLLRGVTYDEVRLEYGDYISTHTPLARRDTDCASLYDMILDFYSHASCEA